MVKSPKIFLRFFYWLIFFLGGVIIFIVLNSSGNVFCDFFFFVFNNSGNSDLAGTLITIIVRVDIDLARGTFHQTGSPRYGLLKLTLFWQIFLLRMRNDEVRSSDPCQQRLYKNRSVTLRSPLAKETLSFFLMVGNTHTSFFMQFFLFVLPLSI